MRLFWRLFLLLFLLVLLGAAYLMWWSNQDLRLKQSSITLQIRSGSGVTQVVQSLQSAGVDVSGTMLSLYIRLSGKSKKIRAGSYKIEQGTSAKDLLEMLVEGRQVQARFTIIEGWNFSQVKQALAQLPGLVPTIDGMSDAQIMQILGRPGIHPEGRFFPDTYYLPNGSKDTVALKLAMQTMDKHLQQAWQTRNSQSVLRTPDELLTLASIIEKETGLASDRQNIASVFHNRLRIGMRLQTDPAVIYGIGQNFDGNLTKKHLRTDTAYNTYTRTGLPPTPIAMPGAAALNAAAQPAQSKYLYFVSRGDGSSAFSENLQQHNRAVKQYILDKP